MLQWMLGSFEHTEATGTTLLENAPRIALDGSGKTNRCNYFVFGCPSFIVDADDQFRHNESCANDHLQLVLCALEECKAQRSTMATSMQLAQKRCREFQSVVEKVSAERDTLLTENVSLRSELSRFKEAQDISSKPIVLHGSDLDYKALATFKDKVIAEQQDCILKLKQTLRDSESTKKASVSISGIPIQCVTNSTKHFSSIRYQPLTVPAHRRNLDVPQANAGSTPTVITPSTAMHYVYRIATTKTIPKSYSSNRPDPIDVDEPGQLHSVEGIEGEIDLNESEVASTNSDADDLHLGNGNPGEQPEYYRSRGSLYKLQYLCPVVWSRKVKKALGIPQRPETYLQDDCILE